MIRSSAGLSAQLAEFVSSASYADLPAVVVDSAVASLLDAVGVTLAASSLGEGCEAFADLVIAEGGRADSTVFGFGARVPAAAAALANGAMAHALDFEDAYDPAPSHPNAQVVPAVLALAEQFDLSGQQLVTAIAVGCDITCRLATAVGNEMAVRSWYPPPILGALGATAAASNLMGFSARQSLDALSLAVSQSAASGEVKHNPRSIIRGIRDSFAAQAAVRAVQLAGRGISGFDAPLEGADGFFAAYSGGRYDPDAVLGGLGSEFAGPQVSFKPWPSCRATHAFVEGALLLGSELELDDIASVELVGAPVNQMLAEPRAGKCAPTTAIDAKFSLPFTVATALVTGTVTLESYLPGELGRADVLELAKQVTFIPDGSLSRSADMSVGQTVVHLKNGTSRRHHVVAPRGAPANPMSAAELRAKFMSCAALARHPLAAADAEALADALTLVHTLPRVRQLFDVLSV